ncbi:amino acid adenylation domain-containing protein [Variovorax sp. J22R133]|uniref:polyketide synthase n=1 Tax=Variovorax brevis TaxID=3053503 RepID=UPI0025785E23|nr:polyketide synthase [Variovorax sp. J22R133]MDM0115085.1 amino acid adenylation domain-containing protein [Variovorax sp. J22R133]
MENPAIQSKSDDRAVFTPIHQRIAQQAASRPDAPAVTCDGVTISFGELDQRANRIAHRLRAAGAGRDQLVAVGMERSIDMVVALLAVLKSGAAYLPIDLAYPRARLEFVLGDAQPVAILTSSASQAELPAVAAPIILMDDESLAEMSAQDTGDADPASLAYVIYTSGSTGTPKGCLVTHGNMTRLFDATHAWFGFDSSDVWTFFHSHAFDFSVWEIWGALAYGGRVVVVPQAVTRSPSEFLDLLVREGVTVLNQTPSAFRTLIDADGQQRRPAEDFRLKHVIFGGEALELQMLRPWFDRHGDTQPRLVNMYGITETTVHVTYRPIDAADVAAGRGSVIGKPIPDLRIDLVSDTLTPVAVGEAGEIIVSGGGVSNGYLRRPELTAERFIAWTDPASGQVLRAYRSGDLARRLPDGDLEYMGRIDQQVKIRGFRIETGEIESELLHHPSVRGCAVVARQDGGTEPRLVAYVVPQADASISALELRSHLGDRIPAYMVPSAFVEVAALPMTENGKLDRRALPAPPRVRPELAQAYEEGRTPTELRVCAAFARALGIEQVGRLDNFFDLGGDSLRVHRVLADLQEGSARKLSANLFFRQPTPQALAAATDEEAPRAGNQPGARAASQPADQQEPIALIAMAGRFPGANDVEGFWNNLVAGRESITFFDDTTLDAGVSAALRADPAYVRARGVIDGIEDFDAAFFGINPKEAELMDPQQRVFLEICWECLERGGYAPDRCEEPVGVYGGMNNATYFQKHLSTRPDLVEAVGEFQVMLANEKDFIATRVANRINLTGPAVSIHTACSTSLVAVHEAFHALRTGQCTMALAGGVAINCPPRSGYMYLEGAMLSPDGHTRSFDKNAQGTVFCDGAAVVLLKRLSDALADGDPIYAVLRGSAINNDGGAKASFTAPSVDGQSKVIGAALASAGVDARSISYVETHGTATPMGDPVEIEALTKAYARHTADTEFCRIGSVKSNVGHLIMAAGATGLIKTALSLHTGHIPASLHFEAPNPAIDFASTPFRVNDRLSPWPRSDAPRRAGVSSFGVGGTNAHVIVEEAPLRAPSDPGVGLQLLMLSARSPAALAAASTRLADHLEANPDISLADVAHTLRIGRKHFAQRACVVADSVASAVEALRKADSPARTAGATSARLPQPVFVFPGQGAQYAGMGKSLYASGRAHRAAFDDCLRGFEGVLDFDLRERMFSPDPAALAPTSVTQPATFTLEYVLAKHLLSLGIKPQALIGHSVGEFVAAVLAGVMSLHDAARLVARRGALMQALPAGVMLSVRLPASDLLPRLPATVSLAADNGPTACVAAGPADEIEKLRAVLEADGVVAKVLQTSHAFHSAMMDPAVPAFEALVRDIELKAPTLPIYSTLTGRLLTDQEATDPHYWARHLRETVRFSPAVREVLAKLSNPLFVELGPRNTLATLVRQHGTKAQPATSLSLLADSPAEEERASRLAAGRLWALGAEIDLAPLDPRLHKLRLCLPTYPFERKRLWVEIATAAAPATVAAPAVEALPVPTLPTPAIPEPTMTTATPARLPSLTSRLRELFEDISGIDLAEAEGSMPFVEMGLDSLTLTQAALQVKKTFKVNLSFRQLMETYRSFDSLGEFLDATLPPEPVAAPVAVAAVAPVAVASPVVAPVAQQAAPAMVAMPVPTMTVPAGAGTLVQQVIAQQMQLMQQQLALLSGASAPMAAPVATPVAQVATASAPAVIQTPAAPAVTTPTAAQQTAPADASDAPQGPIKYDVKKAFGAIARIHTQAKEPTERQKARLAAFIRRYVERTRKSKEFTAANRPHMADPRVVNGFRPATKEIVYQVVVEKSKGSRLWDLDGNEYVDVLNGFGMNLFGWQPDFINDAVRKQLDLGYEIGPQHPLAAEVTQQICDLTGFDRAALCNTGSESVMAAIRIARTVTGRNTVVLFTGSYHGTFDEVLVRAGRNAKGMSAAPGVMQGMFGDVRVLDYGTPEALEFIRSNADDLAAVLVEPVQSRRPDFQPREFLREVRAITEKAGSCLIFDEVITGFRSHLGGAQAIFGIRADLACYGKVIGGGFPVGVIAGKREYMDSLDGGGWQYGDDSMPTVGVTYFAGTFVRHPLALSACKVSLDHLKQAGDALQTTLNLHTAAMADELTAFCREVGAPIEIRYFSSLWRVTWLEDHPLQDLLFAMMRSRGVHILDNFPCFMTTAHTQQDIALIKSAFKESVAEMQEAEFLPRNVPASNTSMDASRPPLPNARLGRDKDGQPAWFIPDPASPGKFRRVEV